MDVLSVGFLVLVIGLGGLIAFFADRLGRTLGKKRHSLFGLRPRHTAALLTVSAGIVIPLVTVLIVMAMSSDLRTVLLRGSRLLDDERKTRAQLVGLNAQRSQLNEQNVSLTKQNAGAKSQLADLRKQLDAGNAVIHDLQGRQSLLAAKVKASETLIRDTKLRVATLRGQLTAASGRLKGASAAYRQLETKRSGLQASFDVLSQQQKDLNQQNHKLDQENQKLASDLDTLRPEVDSLQHDKLGLSNDIADLRQSLQSNRRDSETIRIELDKQRAELDSVQANLDFANRLLTKNLGSTRLNPMVYGFGAELTRLALEPKLSLAEAENAVTSLIRAARVQAQGLGATDAQLPPINAGNRQVDEAEQRLGIAREISKSGENVVIVAYAAVNTFKGEPVPLAIKTFRNPVVYQDGQTVAEIRVDGRLPIADILARINEFVSVTVKEKALHDHMIPRTGSDAPLGAVAFGRLLELANAVKADSRTVRVTAYAHGTTRAADVLTLDLNNH